MDIYYTINTYFLIQNLFIVARDEKSLWKFANKKVFVYNWKCLFFYNLIEIKDGKARSNFCSSVKGFWFIT